MSDSNQDLGTIVNEREGEESNFPSIEEARLVLRITPKIFDRLVNAATYHQYPSVEDYCITKLIDTLTNKVGAASIDAPSQMSGRSDLKKITGPKGGIISRG